MLKNENNFIKKISIVTGIFSIIIILFFLLFYQLREVSKEDRAEIANIKNMEGDISDDKELEILYFRKKISDLNLFKKFEKTYQIKTILLNNIEEPFENWLENQNANDNYLNSYQGDVIVFNSIKELSYLLKKDLLFSIQIDIPNIEKQVPKKFRSRNKNWFGLVQEPMIIVYNHEKINPKKDGLENYKDLADKKWKDKILVSTSRNHKIQSLIAYMIKSHGKEEAEKWTKDFVDNLVQNPMANEDELFKALNEGKGDIGLLSRSNFFKHFSSSPQKEEEENKQVLNSNNMYRIFRPNQKLDGTHVDISGIAILKGSKHKKNAIQFLRYMTSLEVQRSYKYTKPHEIPISIDIKDNEVKISSFHIEEIIAHLEEADTILKSVAWN